MKTLVSVLVLATLAAAAWCWGATRPLREESPAPTANAAAAKRLGRLPVAFVPNVGQWEHRVRYRTRVGAMTVFLETKGWTFTLVERTAAPRNRETAKEHAAARGVAVRMTFAGASEPVLVAQQQLPGRHHYFLGNDPAKWRSDVPLHGAVLYRGLHAGVDVRAREHDGHFEYDLLLEPRADLDLVEIAVEGTERLQLDPDGALVLQTPLGPVRMPVPSSWEVESGEQHPVACRYVLRGPDRFGFAVAGRHPDRALVVDPGLVWSTFLGTTGYEVVAALALDAQGEVTMAGWTDSIGFPTTPGAFDPTYNGASMDAFVARLSASGTSLVYSTFLGGASHDNAAALAVDALGAATVAGQTFSSNFPTTPGAFDTTYNGGFGDAFVIQLATGGSSLVYSTFLGGPGDNIATALAIDALGAATVAGHTFGSGFPTTPGAFATSPIGTWDCFVTRFTPLGTSLVFSTLLGGTATDHLLALAVDAQGACTVAGQTGGLGFPTTPGAFDTTYNGGTRDAFVAQLSPTGASLVYSTFLGGTDEDAAGALAVDALGQATVAGWTRSTFFPTTPSVFGTTHSGGIGGIDGFVTRLSASGASLVYSTFLGGSAGIGALALDTQGACTVAGSTSSPGFPVTPGAFDTSYNGPFGGPPGGYDAFVARLSPTASTRVYATFLGGSSNEIVNALALDAQGGVVVAGYTLSADFPTTPGAFDTTYNGGSGDAFVTRLDMLPTGVSAFGTSSPGCSGPLAISVTSMPRVGNSNFSLTCGNAPPSSTGWIAFTDARFLSPVPVLGVAIWIDPSVVFVMTTVSSNPLGGCEVPLPIPNDPALVGSRFYSQFLWFGASSPAPCPPLGFSASNALDFTVQP